MSVPQAAVATGSHGPSARGCGERRITCIGGGAAPVWNIAPPRAAAIIGEGPAGPGPYGPAHEGGRSAHGGERVAMP